MRAHRLAAHPSLQLPYPKFNWTKQNAERFSFLIGMVQQSLRVEENRAEVNFELVERLAEREERDWTYFGRLRHEREKKLRDPQDVLIDADRLRQRMKKRRAQRRRTPRK